MSDQILPSDSRPQLPSLATQAVNFGKAVASEAAAIATGKDPVSADEHARRLNLCFACPMYDNGRCLICGCNMHVKSGWRSQKCADTPPKW